MRDDRSLIKMKDLERILAKFRIKFQEKQRDVILKLYCVQYVGDPSIINI